MKNTTLIGKILENKIIFKILPSYSRVKPLPHIEMTTISLEYFDQ